MSTLAPVWTDDAVSTLQNVATKLTAAAAAPKPKERIYLSGRLSDYFGVDYNNEGKTTTIHTSALDRGYAGDCDEAHQAIIDRGGELRLKGTGYGWWEVVA